MLECRERHARVLTKATLSGVAAFLDRLQEDDTGVLADRSQRELVGNDGHLPRPAALGPALVVVHLAIRVFCDEAPLPEEDAVPVELPAATEESEFELTVWLALSDHFACDEPTKRLTIYRDEPESTTAEFAMSVVDKPPAGPGHVSAIFNYHGQPSGHVTPRVAIEVALDEDRDRAPQRAVVRVGQQLPHLTIAVVP